MQLRQEWQHMARGQRLPQRQIQAASETAEVWRCLLLWWQGIPHTWKAQVFWTHLKLTYKNVHCNYTLAFCRLGWRTALKQLAVCTIAFCSSLFANVIDETILIWSENHPNFDTYRMRSRLLYIPMGAKGLSSTHRREEEWRRKKCEAPSGITSPEKIVPLSTDILQFGSSSRVKNGKLWLYLRHFRPLAV